MIVAEAYLSAHYELLREDAVKPLRDAVGVVRANPSADENALPGAIGIYEKVSWVTDFDPLDLVHSCHFIC